MPNHSLFVFIFVIISCNSTTTDNEPKIETKKKDSISENSTLKVVDQIKDSSIIYDTLVFTDAMNGELLNNKFALSQPELNYYKQFISPKKLNKLIVIDEKDTKTEIRYLGEIKDLNNKTYYHVITSFRIFGIGEMLSPRGKSDVVFVNKSKNKIIVYNLAMPENLPKYVMHNVLFFEYDNTRAGISIIGGLPPLLCLPEIGCH